MKKTDVTLQQRVIDELAAESDLDGSTIGVSVRNGIVRLVGSVSTLADQQAAERAARRVAGPAEVVDDLKVVATAMARAGVTHKRDA